MADVSQTATAVHAWSGAQIIPAQAGVAIVPGDWVYFDTADSKYKLATGASGAAEAVVAGMSLGYAPADTNYFPLCTGGDVDVGATLTVGGSALIISAAVAGNMAPIADLSTGEYGTILGRQKAADIFTIDIQVMTVASA